MKRYTPFIVLFTLCLMITQVTAEDGNLFDEIKELAEAEAEEQLSPVVQAFGTATTGGLYHTAGTHSPFGFDIGVRTMIVSISDGEGILDSVDVSVLGVPVVQASMGLPMDFEVMLRGFSIKVEDETISLFGAGLKKNFTPNIPMVGLPDISAMLAFHKFKAGDILGSTHLSFDLMVSKKFAIVTPYLGFGIDKHNMDIEYDYVDSSTGVDITVPIELNMKETTSRLTLGMSITPFPFLKLFGDYNIGKYNEITGGLLVSIR